MNKETGTILGICLVVAGCFFGIGYSIGEEKVAIKGLYEGWDIGHRQCIIEESESDDKTYVFIPTDTNEVDPRIFKEVNRIIEILNNGN